MEAQALGASVINVLLQFIPTPDEIAKVTKFVDKKHVAPPPPPAAAEGATEGSTAAPEVKPPVTEAKTEVAKDNGKVDQKRLNELKIGKAEQFIFHMSKVSLEYLFLDILRHLLRMIWNC